MSFSVPGYSGLLYEKGNSRTPLLTSIINRTKYTNSVKYVLGQNYTNETVDSESVPAISENASLTAPAPSFVTRGQKYNVTQIFQESLYISDAKKSNMGTLGTATAPNVNIANQVANPANELDFQIARKMDKIRNQIEFLMINGIYNEATSDTTVNKMRGLNQAITTNVITATGTPTLDLFMIDQLLISMDNNGADISNITLLCDNNTRSQLVANAVEMGVPVGEAFETEYGIRINSIVLQNGVVNIMTGRYIPAGTCYLLDLAAISPVAQPVPGKGNFYLEELGKAGAGEKYHIFGQMGLDYGMEFLHGKITGLSTAYAKPVGRKVVTVTSA